MLETNKKAKYKRTKSTSPSITEDDWISHFRNLLYKEDEDCQEPLINKHSTIKTIDLDNAFSDADIHTYIIKL